MFPHTANSYEQLQKFTVSAVDLKEFLTSITDVALRNCGVYTKPYNVVAARTAGLGFPVSLVEHICGLSSVEVWHSWSPSASTSDAHHLSKGREIILIINFNHRFARR